MFYRLSYQVFNVDIVKLLLFQKISSTGFYSFIVMVLCLRKKKIWSTMSGNNMHRYTHNNIAKSHRGVLLILAHHASDVPVFVPRVAQTFEKPESHQVQDFYNYILLLSQYKQIAALLLFYIIFYYFICFPSNNLYLLASVECDYISALILSRFYFHKRLERGDMDDLGVVSASAMREGEDDISQLPQRAILKVQQFFLFCSMLFKLQ